MAQLAAEQIQRIIETCRAQTADLRESFRTNLRCEVRLTAAEPQPYAADAVAAAYSGPGLAVSLVVGDQGILLLVPEQLPLPAWYRQPSISENNQLQTFAYELSMLLLPADLLADRYTASPAESLKEAAERMQVNSAATMLELSAFPDGAAEGDPPTTKLLIVVPVDSPNLPPPKIETPAPPAEEKKPSSAPPADSDRGSGTPKQTAVPPLGNPQSADQAMRALRILRVPVTVSVRLAERKVPLGQVVGLAPGALVTFTKSCEELLDLYVNNFRYCQGEAVKIGESFGLKIARVGVTEERKEHVF